MSDFEKARRQMVDCQIRPNDITDHDVIAAFGAVPREMFVPQTKKAIAYIDSDIMLEAGAGGGPDRFLMQVMPFAKMVQAADIRPEDFVLCIGCGSGYGAAVVAKLASSVIAIDESATLVERASGIVNEMGIDNLAVMKGNPEKGCSGEAPFDIIVIEGGVDDLPEALFAQLRDNGRLVAAVGNGPSAQLCVYRKQGDHVSVTKIGNVCVPHLPGFKQEEAFVF